MPEIASMLTTAPAHDRPATRPASQPVSGQAERRQLLEKRTRSHATASGLNGAARLNDETTTKAAQGFRLSDEANLQRTTDVREQVARASIRWSDVLAGAL
jgi:hypothetical protein